ncbi:response regulator [Mobilitalea sibirica]|nr:response regulator [Mobilitalea sibirica]
MQKLITISNVLEEYLLIITETGSFLHANTSFLHKFGYTLSEVMNMKLYDLYPEDTKAKVEQILISLKNKSSEKAYIHMLLSDGQLLSVDSQFLKCELDDTSFIIVKSNDISANKKHKLFLDETLASINEFIYYKDTEGKYLFCNKTCADQLFGLDEAAIIGKKGIELIKDKTTLENCMQSDLMVLNSGHRVTIEEDIMLANGTIIRSETTKTPFFDSNGKIIGIIGVMRDISQRLFMENSLKDQELRLNMATASGDIGLWDWKIESINVNEKGAEILGYKKEELTPLLNDDYGQLLHKEDIIKVQNEIIKTSSIGEFDLDFRVKHKNHHWIWLQVKGKVIEWDVNKKPHWMLGTFIDISKAKKLEEELKIGRKILTAITYSIKDLLDNQEYMDAIRHSLPLLGKAAEIDRILLFVNHWDNDETKRSSLKLEWMDESQPSLMSDHVFQNIKLDEYFLARQLEQGREYKGKSSELSQNGLSDFLTKYNMNSILLLPIHVSNSFWGFIGFIDADENKEWPEAHVTAFKTYINSVERAIERRIMNQELRKAKIKAERASLLKSRFLANMSHEIRTPMNVIAGYVDLMQNTDLTKLQSSYLDSIKSATETLLLTINDILDYSKLEADKMILDNIIFNIKSLIEDSIGLFIPKVVGKNIAIEWSISPKVPEFFYGDPGRLKQILFNLISNAIKFTDIGYVRISVEMIKQTKETAKLGIKVSDTGIGMSSQVLERLFSEFTQADASTTRKYGGTGLGLAITKRLVELMKGKICAHSIEGQGSEFCVTIDLNKVINASDIVMKIADEDDSTDTSYSFFDQYNKKYKRIKKIKKRKILLVEDTPANQKLLQIIITQLGYEVLVAENGLKALELCENEKYDLILMDCQMPIMDGYEATKIIKKQGLNKETVIIALTAHAMEDDRKKCLESGMNDYISKPITRSELKTTIEKWLT